MFKEAAFSKEYESSACQRGAVNSNGVILACKNFHQGKRNGLTVGN